MAERQHCLAAESSGQRRSCALSSALTRRGLLSSCRTRADSTIAAVVADVALVVVSHVRVVSVMNVSDVHVTNSTGELDMETAGKLGVSPEDRRDTGDETTKVKPSAGIKWPKGSRRTTRKGVKAAAAPESSWRDREKALQAEGDNHPR